jgi:glutaredoxin
MKNLLLVAVLALCGWKAYEHFVLKPRAQEAIFQNAAHDELIMYSLTTCGYCEQKRRELNAAGIKFRERFIDKDKLAGKELREQMRAQGIAGGRIGTPTFDVGGRIMPNNPPLSAIIKHLPPNLLPTRS